MMVFNIDLIVLLAAVNSLVQADNGVAENGVAKCIVENLVAKENFEPALV